MCGTKSWKAVLLVLSVFLSAAAWSFAASVPQMINYQGTLTSNGTKPTGSVNMTFSVYSTSTGGTPLWTENWSSSGSPANPVIVSSGAFNVMLGAINPFPPTFFADHTKTYLGIKVGTDSEMLPRQQFASVGYSFSAGNGVPKGGIIMWSGAVNLVPDGWALCDGTNGTPDLRDRFVVGAGSSYSVGQTGGEAMHTLTIAEMPGHTHSDAGHTHIEQKYNSSGGTTAVGGGAGTGLNVTTTPTLTGYANIQPTGGGQPHNILPPYYALAFIMKL